MTVPEPTAQKQNSLRTENAWLRTLLLGLILLAFARLVWQLGAKNFWWDESLTLQRAESDWWPLLRGTLLLKDGFIELPTTDQHPFFYFMLTGILIRVAGTTEFVVRFVSVMAATLLVPTVWICAQQFAQQQVIPRTAPTWAALFAAISPFFLWYGQEARPYALWTCLALLCTYFLIRTISDSTQSKRQIQRNILVYGITLVLFLTTQYLSILLLPVHAILIFLWQRKSNPKLAFWAVSITLAAGGLIGAAVAWILLSQGGAGSNFSYVSPAILIPDLLNAFSMGLSVNINQVWWVDLLYGAVALIGALWAIRSREALRRHGWVLPAFIIIPLLAMLLINLVQSAYMNARHMSFLGGGFLLLLGSGLGALWQTQRILAAVIALIMISAAGYSTNNYFHAPEYAQKYDDYSSLGRFVEKRLLPDDIVLYKQPYSWRIFDYYLPLDSVEKYGVPFTGGIEMQTTRDRIDAVSADARRVWLITSGTTPSHDPENLIEAHLNETMFRVQERTFYSHSSLTAQIFLPTVPVYNEPIDPPGTEIDILFGDQIRLIAYQVGQPLSSTGAVPVTLTWQTMAPTETRYKYILELINANGQALGITEREPYDGAISTNFWQPNQTIVEYSEVPPNGALPALGDLAIRLQVYAPDTFEKLPITQTSLPESSRIENDVAVVLKINP